MSQILKSNENEMEKVIIMMDNASYHKGKMISEFLIERNIKVLYVSPYSPQISPIELLFGSLKSMKMERDDLNLSSLYYLTFNKYRRG